jgi:hypothetical protein
MFVNCINGISSLSCKKISNLFFSVGKVTARYVWQPDKDVYFENENKAVNSHVVAEFQKVTEVLQVF